MKLILLLAVLSTCATAQSKKNASAMWITNGAIDPKTKVMKTLVKMSMEESWHTYWLNPGDSGLAPSIKVELPEGWNTGQLQFPVPKRFKTGELAGFGYEGEVYFPLDLIAPDNYAAPPPAMKATFSWLVCNNDSCVPGKEEMVLESGEYAELISKEYRALPTTLNEAKLSISKSEDSINLFLTLPNSSDLDPSKFEVLSVTPDIIAPTAKPAFAKTPSKQNEWKASAPMNEYLSDNPTRISILLKYVSGASYLVSTP